jgi:hypothetical protein
MRAVRQIYDRIPPMIEIPEALQHRCIEVVFLELETASCQHDGLQPEWPEGLFERTAGAWQGEPLARAPQGEYEQRLELE